MRDESPKKSRDDGATKLARLTQRLRASSEARKNLRAEARADRKMVCTTVYFTSPQLDALKACAKHSGISMSNIIREAVTAHLFRYSDRL